MRSLLTLLLLLLSPLTLAGKASPYIVGFGSQANPGQSIVRVTNLNATGVGSLKACMETANSICVFDVCGIIDMGSTNIDIASGVWVAGQTCPDNGSGIVLMGDQSTIDFQDNNPDDVIIQHLTVVSDWDTVPTVSCSGGWGTTIQADSGFGGSTNRVVFDSNFYLFNENKPVNQRNNSKNFTFSNSFFGPGAWSGAGGTKAETQIDDGCTSFTGPFIDPIHDNDDMDTTIYNSVMMSSQKRSPKFSSGRQADIANNVFAYWYQGISFGTFTEFMENEGWNDAGINMNFKGNYFIPAAVAPTGLGEAGGVKTRIYMDSDNIGPWCGGTYDYTDDCYKDGTCQDSGCTWASADMETYIRRDAAGPPSCDRGNCTSSGGGCDYGKAVVGGTGSNCLGEGDSRVSGSCVDDGNETDCCWCVDSDDGNEHTRDKHEATSEHSIDALYQIPSAQLRSAVDAKTYVLANVGPRKYGVPALMQRYLDEIEDGLAAADVAQPYNRFRTYGLCDGSSDVYAVEADLCWWGGGARDGCDIGETCSGFCFRNEEDGGSGPGERYNCLAGDCSRVLCADDDDCPGSFPHCTEESSRGWTEPFYDFSADKVIMEAEETAGSTWQGQTWTDGDGDGMHDAIEAAIWTELSTPWKAPGDNCTVLESETTKAMGATWTGKCAHELMWRQMDPTGNLYVAAGEAACTTDCYVAEDGDNDAAGNFSSPFATIQYCMDQAGPGDTCHIRVGTYSEWVVATTSGTLGNPITVTNYQSEMVIIDGTTPTVSAFWGLFDFANEDYITLDGLTVRNSDAYCIRSGSGAVGNQVLNNTVHDCGSTTAIMFTENSTAAINAIISGNTVYNSGEGGIVSWQNTVGGILIENNTVYDAQGTFNWDLIQSNDTPWVVIRGNTVYGMKTSAGDYIDVGGNLGPISNALIENNIVYFAENGDDAEGVKLNNEPSRFAIIRGNQLYDVNMAFYETPFSEVRIYNNTIYVSGATGSALNSIIFWIGGETVAFSDVVLKNNVFSCYTGTSCLQHTTSGAERLDGDFDSIGFDYNLYRPNSNIAVWIDATPDADYTINAGNYASVWRGGDLNQEPSNGGIVSSAAADLLFVNAGARDVTPASGSPLIDAGGALTETTNGGTGTGPVNVIDASYFWPGVAGIGSPADTITIGDDTVLIASISGNAITLDSSITWVSGEDVSLEYNGTAPDIGAVEAAGGAPPVTGETSASGVTLTGASLE